MKVGQLFTYVAILAVGVAIGLFSHNRIFKTGRVATKTEYVERHEGQFRHINPLLACDVAGDVLSDPELVGFKDKVAEYVKERADKRLVSNISVYFRELNDGYWFSIGEVDKFIPASLRKVPVMIALLKQAESDPKLLERVVTFDLSNDYNQNQNIKPSRSLVVGNKYSIGELIFRMIVYSDNNAFTYLTKIVNPEQLNKVYASLRMQNPGSSKDDEFLSVQTYASFFRILYNTSYLSREASDWALGVLAQSEFKAGLVAGVPQNIEVAHKFGEKSESDGVVQLHDCGIVYYPKHPYLLCVMSKGNNFGVLDDVIADISRITFTEIDAQNSKKQ